MDEKKLQEIESELNLNCSNMQWSVDTIQELISSIRSLLERDQFLSALIDAGVDNWSGYNYAQELYREMQEE